ncbi:MAG: Argininosuccinate synthase [bacterium ADurb.Bin478]|nr:MAG: Argininosuccinate synthase [bacterium ADurb.Bin478]
MFVLSVSPEKAPDRPTYVEVNFESGIPVGLNGKRMAAVPLVQELNKLAGANGIGRADIVENRLVGMKSRGVYETPAGTVLYFAHRELESLVLDRETLYQKEMLVPRYAQLVYNGAWYTPVREALDAFVTVTQKLVTGTVRLKLYKGNVISAGRKSPYSLYREDFATFSEEDVYDQKDAKGFINLFGLPLTVRALVQQEWDKQASHELPGLKYKRD